MTARVIAGFDLATSSGAVLMDGDKVIHSELFRASGKTDGEIFSSFRKWLIPLLKGNGVEAAAIEQPLRSDIRKKNKDGTEQAITNMATYLKLYGYRAHAIQILDALGIDAHEVNQATWRKAFTGTGRASKEDSVARCKSLGLDITSKDVAEAAGVAFWLRGHLQEQDLFRRVGDAA